MAEGLHLFADNGAFEELFGDFKRKYGLRCILQGMGARWPSEEEKWAFWSRLIRHYCGMYKKSAVMCDLQTIVGEKDYFIITSNGECHFEMSGFAPDKIYEIEGEWLNMQCALRCHDTLYPTLEPAAKMAAAQENGRIPADLVPRCPVCKGPMQIHMIMDKYFIPKTESRMRYENFLKQYRGKKLAVLELGIGWRNQLIKEPLMRLVDREPNAFYMTINLGEVYILDNIREKSLGFDGPLEEILSELSAEYRR
ncbi:MAG TPA: NAD-dependent protein deacetylase, SIR2 family [Candidatus Eubacterium avistercoris]|uniref:NAD-dependent protein deacetylase, SIR2 family n=1 Tax=Candidatus Eubacterium avistercoris TaxID=2838567 RepID=A0A9D2IHP0_9FIRM|nr:NAD-dependent protein deacetylase, SIR2 family [Candidatus Eubacterium avistercoris]